MSLLRSVVLLLATALVAALPADESASGSAAVWRVTGAEGTVYLAGSIHVLRPRDYPLPAAYETAWDETDTLYLEIAPEVLADPNAVAPFIGLLMNPDGRTLDQQLAAAATRGEIDEIRRRVRELGLDLTPLQPFRPWYAAISVMQTVLMREGYDPAWGVDQRFGNRAMAESRPAYGLETLGEQLGILASLTPAQEAEFLLGILRDAEDLDAEIRPLMDAWRSGDEEALADIVTGGFHDFPELEAKLLTDRNARWFQQLVPLLDRPGRHLVVVGTLHLVGDGGLLRLFKRAGYDGPARPRSTRNPPCQHRSRGTSTTAAHHPKSYRARYRSRGGPWLPRRRSRR